MADFEELRRYALTLPEVEEEPWYDNLTLKARNKGFAYSFKGNALLRLGRERLEFLLEVRPETFTKFPLPGGNWASVDLADLDSAELEALVREAWAGVVPKKLSRMLPA